MNWIHWGTQTKGLYGNQFSKEDWIELKSCSRIVVEGYNVEGRIFYKVALFCKGVYVVEKEFPTLHETMAFVSIITHDDYEAKLLARLGTIADKLEDLCNA